MMRSASMLSDGRDGAGVFTDSESEEDGGSVATRTYTRRRVSSSPWSALPVPRRPSKSGALFSLQHVVASSHRQCSISCHKL